MVLIQSVLLMPRIVFAVLNGAVYVVMANIIFAYAKEKRYVISILYLFIWFFMPAFAEVVTWTTGCITYLWMNTVVLGFGLIYYRDYAGYSDKDESPGSVSQTILRFVLMVLLGFCAGLSTETGACTLVFALFLYVCRAVRGHHKIRADRIAGIVSALVGFAVLMLAPGNRVRATVSATASENASFVSIYSFRIARESFYALMYLLIPAAICVGVYLWRSEIEVRMNMLLFGVLALVSVFVLTFSAGFADRVFQFPILMLAVALNIGIPAFSGRSEKVLSVVTRMLMLMVIVEITAGSLYARQAGTYFDRHMRLYADSTLNTSGLIPGNGLTGQDE
ncbi:MAG: hypothetical protein IJS12_10540 [Lachnospiraceae bacterium]|nr:hypothetical protein [Lachnospiraceae bacterium]